MVLLTIVILAINPARQFGNTRNLEREQDLGTIADAIASYTQEKNKALFLSISTGAAMEICGDSITGSCASLLDIRVLMPNYMSTIPLDPLSEDPDVINEHTRYFLSRTSQHFTITAPDTEPLGDPDLSVIR